MIESQNENLHQGESMAELALSEREGVYGGESIRDEPRSLEQALKK